MGLFGGGGASQTAFGSSSGDVLTRMTAILATVFMLLTLTLAFLKTDPADKDRIKKVIQDTINKKKSKSGTESAEKNDDKTGSETNAAKESDESSEKEPATKDSN